MNLSAKLQRTAVWLLRALQRALGASTVGVRAIVTDGSRRVLLVRHTYRPGWYLPGGGVSGDETPSEAVARELMEEAGVVVRGEPQLFGIYFQRFMGVRDYPALYVVTEFDARERKDRLEIAEVRWVEVDLLPSDVTAGTRRRIEEYFNGVPRTERW